MNTAHSKVLKFNKRPELQLLYGAFI